MHVALILGRFAPFSHLFGWASWPRVSLLSVVGCACLERPLCHVLIEPEMRDLCPNVDFRSWGYEERAMVNPTSGAAWGGTSRPFTQFSSFSPPLLLVCVCFCVCAFCVCVFLS